MTTYRTKTTGLYNKPGGQLQPSTVVVLSHLGDIPDLRSEQDTWQGDPASWYTSPGIGHSTSESREFYNLFLCCVEILEVFVEGAS